MSNDETPRSRKTSIHPWVYPRPCIVMQFRRTAHISIYDKWIQTKKGGERDGEIVAEETPEQII